VRIWRCAGKRPFGAPCRRRVAARPRWNTTWRCWTGPLCDRCWRDALRYEPDRDAAIASDPNAPDWVLEHLAGSRDPLVLAGLAARGEHVRADLRRKLEQSTSPVVRDALAGTPSMTPAWSLYRSTPRPGVVGASIVATTLAVVAVMLLETSRPASSVDQAAPTSVPAPTRPASIVSAPTTIAEPVVTPTVAGTVSARFDLPTASTLPNVTDPLVVTTPAAPPTSATTTTTIAPPPSTTIVVVEPPAAAAAPVQAVQAPPASAPPGTTAVAVPSGPVARSVTFDVPFAATVSYVGSYGVVDVVLRSPDGTTFRGATSAEGSGPPGRWTADIQTSGAWAGEFTSRG
jgi:hypothetical protein